MKSVFPHHGNNISYYEVSNIIYKKYIVKTNPLDTPRTWWLEQEVWFVNSSPFTFSKRNEQSWL